MTKEYTKEYVREKMLDAGHTLKDNKQVQNGNQLCFSNGSKVTVYSTGTISVQGKNKEEVEKILDCNKSRENNTTQNISNNKNKVFVVYGHDIASRNELEAMLRRWKLEPLILDQLPSGGTTIIEKLEKYTQEVNFAIILATPDDIGYQKNHEDEKKSRARQNVVLELGMMLAKLGRERVVILLKNQSEMERPSDIQGLLYIPFTDSVSDGKVNLAKELNNKGYTIDIENL